MALEKDFVLPDDWNPENALIKVIGVGGGGCNAVTYMYNQQIEGCSFIVCNTDSQALQKSNVPTKIQLGEGLGAGTDPIGGRNAALESQEVIARIALDSGTRMLFITAGLGGGTGTGASPVIAKMAKDRGILTVAVVTIPFANEGNESQSKAIDGIRELEQTVDSLLIINNEKLYEYFGDELVQDAFPKADEVLATAVRGIIEIISKPGFINVDFKDVTNMMRGSGMALMGTGEGRGEHRLEDAVRGALESPLLNDFDLKTAKNVLVNITVGRNEKGVKMSDMEKINKLIGEYTGNANKFKRGIIYEDDPAFGDRVRITAIATGFDMGTLGNITDVNLGNIIVIDPDFTWTRASLEKGEVELPETPSIKIDFNTTGNACKFNYDTPPCLFVRKGDDLSMLRNVPAVRRH